MDSNYSPRHTPLSSLNATNPSDMSNANLSSDVLLVDNNDLSQIKLNKVPKRVLHFCDGTIEEYSSDEEDETDCQAPCTAVVDPKTLSWGPWFMYHTLMLGSTSLKVCDYLGENLASFFGITTPKYQYEIEEYKRMMAEEEESQKREDLEMGGWREGSSQIQSAAGDLGPSAIAKDFQATPNTSNVPPATVVHSQPITQQRY